MKKIQSTIECDKSLPRNRRYSTTYKPKRKKSKFINQSRKANSSLNKSHKKERYFNN